VGGLGPSQGRNFGLKSGGSKLEAHKAPRIEMPKASRLERDEQWELGDIPLGRLRGSCAVVELYHNL